MTEAALNVFVVDDDPATRMSTSFMLENSNIRIREFEDGVACLAALGDVSSDSPDIILLDIEMPGTDGISVCRAIRESGRTESQIIFISSHDDLETRLKAYDVGGNDYLIKPCESAELVRKIAVAKQAVQLLRDSAAQAKMATKAAFAAMSSMSEMGVTLEFLRSSFVCQSPVELGKVLCNALKQYDLKGIVEFRNDAKADCFSTHGECTALERSILHSVRSMDRIFQFSDRLVINFPMTTVMITNLPLADPDRVGRLRDHLAVITEGAEERFNVMINEARSFSQAESIVGAAAELTRVLQEIEKRQRDNRIQALTIADGHMEALTHTFVHLGLLDNQEAALAALSQELVDKISNLQDYGASVSERLHDVTVRLTDMTSGSTQVR